MIDVKKAKLGDIRRAFRERLIQQLNHDFPLTEAQEVSIRNQLSEIRVCKTNNDRNVIGTMNQWIYTLPYYGSRFGPVEAWDELFISHLLNDTPVTAKVWANKDRSGYFTPREAMKKLVSELKRI